MMSNVFITMEQDPHPTTFNVLYVVCVTTGVVVTKARRHYGRVSCTCSSPSWTSRSVRTPTPDTCKNHHNLLAASNPFH